MALSLAQASLITVVYICHNTFICKGHCLMLRYALPVYHTWRLITECIWHLHVPHVIPPARGAHKGAGAFKEESVPQLQAPFNCSLPQAQVLCDICERQRVAGTSPCQV